MGCEFSKQQSQRPESQPHRRPTSQERQADARAPTLLPRVGRGAEASTIAVKEQKHSVPAATSYELVRTEEAAPAAEPQGEEAAVHVAEAIEAAEAAATAQLDAALDEQPAEQLQGGVAIAAAAATVAELGATEEPLASTLPETREAGVVDEAAAAPTAARPHDEEQTSAEEAVEELHPAQRETAEPGPGLLATFGSTLWTCSVCRGGQRREEEERHEEIAMVEVQHDEPPEVTGDD
eukprot:TRINITY_DN95301_c0_g1_i1.p1 TRINITY_DN95301_c0_g1~~TRINITY_DN95301_c0_g1_i1.p1  ORF type:complete len:257 (-),score=75.76 TRINITY_DN95301_c0_g1_i1:50-760(-)